MMNLQEAKDLIKKYPGQFYTYLLKRPDGRPFYVGKGNCKGFRVGDHVKQALSKKSRNSYKNNIIKKILESGKQIDYEIILFSSEEEVAFDKEMELIALYGRRDRKEGCLTNLTDGGDGPGGYSHTEKAKKKISLASIKHNSEFDQKGEKSYWWGRHHSEESKRKVSKGLQGHLFSKESRQKSSDSHKGKPSNRKGKQASNETKLRLSISHRGLVSGMKGKHHSEESNRKNSESHKGKVHSKETRKKMSDSHKIKNK